MKRILCFLIVLAAISFSQTVPGNAGGWEKLFDGRSLSGWVPQGTGKWTVADGLLVCDSGGDGWLRSSRQFSDFELKIEYRNVVKGNSGVFLRATAETNAADPSNPVGGYELQINNEDPAWATGSIENFIQRLVPVNPAPGQWHSYAVEIRGDHIAATLDGVSVLDGRDPKFKSGHIGLQHHSGNRIEFRNVVVRSLAKSAASGNKL